MLSRTFRERIDCPTTTRSLFDTEAIVFDDRIGKDLARNAVNLRLGGISLQAIIQRQQEILPLPHIGNALILHAPQRISHCLPLGIQHGSFQRDIDMSLHPV